MENFERDYSNESLELAIYPVICPFMDSLKGKYEFNSSQKIALELNDDTVKEDLRKAVLVWDFLTFVEKHEFYVSESTVGLPDTAKIS